MKKNHHSGHSLELAAVLFLTGISSLAFAETQKEYDDETRVTANIMEAFRVNPLLKTSRISVSTSNGIVLLGGFVETRSQETEAMKISESMSGVINVIDGISIRND